MKAWLAGWLAGLAGWAGRLGRLAVLCWLGFFQCPAHGFYSLLLILTAICTGFKFSVIKPMQIAGIINISLIKPMRRACKQEQKE